MKMKYLKIGISVLQSFRSNKIVQICQTLWAVATLKLAALYGPDYGS
jgi:hypothetical protein